MIFLAVGTQFPFDRLVRAVDEALPDAIVGEEVFAQIGETDYKPRNFDSVVSLGKEAFDRYVVQASAVISHAGMGTISLALDNHKPLLVMPRLRRYGEAVNDHQTAIAKRFEQFRYLLAAHQVGDIPTKLKELKSFIPCPRQTQERAIAERIAQFIHSLNGPTGSISAS